MLLELQPRGKAYAACSGKHQWSYFDTKKNHASERLFEISLDGKLGISDVTILQKACEHAGPTFQFLD